MSNKTLHSTRLYVAFACLVGIFTALSLSSASIPQSAAQQENILPAGEWTSIANGNDILAMAREGDTIWAGTRAGGLAAWDVTSGEYHQYLAPQDPLGGNTIHAVEIDEAGRKWLATSNGLTVFDSGPSDALSDDQWLTYTVENTAGGLPTNDVRAIAINGNFVWIGGAQIQDLETKAWSMGGLGRLDTNGSFTPSMINGHR